jgi:hypothetical protein
MWDMNMVMNDKHVSYTFWLRGMNMISDSSILNFFGWEDAHAVFNAIARGPTSGNYQIIIQCIYLSWFCDLDSFWYLSCV